MNKEVCTQTAIEKLLKLDIESPENCKEEAGKILLNYLYEIGEEKVANAYKAKINEVNQFYPLTNCL